MGTRRKSRELTLQMLFQADMGKQTPEQVRQTFWRERGRRRCRCPKLCRRSVPGRHRPRRRNRWPDRRSRPALAHGAHGGRRSQPDACRGCGTAGLSRTPRAVVINEALEIARKFSSPESVQFINGVLDSVGKATGKQTQGLTSARSSEDTSTANSSLHVQRAIACSGLRRLKTDD